MGQFTYPFSFSEDTSNLTTGTLVLDTPLPYQYSQDGSGFYRPGRILLEGGKGLDIVLYHNEATEKFIYLRNAQMDANLLDIAGIQAQEAANASSLVLPGQLCLGSERSKLIAEAIKFMFASPALKPTFTRHRQQNMAIFPIAREGLKYQVTEAIYENYGLYCDEIVLDAHHVFDSSVPVYNRTVELTIFKDKDLDKSQKDSIRVAFTADSIASGLVMREVIARIAERFDHLEQVEVIAPLATVRGLCRIVQSEPIQKFKVRVHVFETILNALPPDFYYSAHFNDPQFHIRPELEQVYRQWWGTDASGNYIADTACAGYGWSEVFYSPRKQIQMMNSQLESRHHLTIADIVRRNISGSFT
jgi:hypothetical protein